MTIYWLFTGIRQTTFIRGLGWLSEITNGLISTARGAFTITHISKHRVSGSTTKKMHLKCAM